MIYLTLFYEFFKIGLFTFGGGLAMIPLIEDAVLRHAWLTEDAFYNFIGVCESTPGPIAVNMATYVGAVQGGVLGSVSATLGVVTPSFLIILLIASVIKNLTKNEWFVAFLQGVKPVVVALILSTGVILLTKTLGVMPTALSPHLPSVILFPAVLGVHFGVKKWRGKPLSSIVLILISALLGLACCLALELCGIAV